MSLKSKLIRIATFILSKKPKTVVAKISYLQPNARLKGKRIVITGGGRGLGLAMAKKFIEEGASVLISGRNEETLKTSAESVGCKYLVLNVQNTNDINDFFIKAMEMLGGVDILINNAGISLHENSFLDVTELQFESQFSTNLKGPFFLSQCFIDKFKAEQGIKKILFTSSETSITADDRPYGLTKCALNSLVQGLAYRYVNDGFRINAIAPGVTISDMVGKTKADDIYCNYNLTERFYLPEEVAEVACFLISDAANCINGQILLCNEGKTINARWK